tara:strand:+ start:296 stop:445 length:150 start_codon:yes stop_codon:yes gene_type:complete
MPYQLVDNVGAMDHVLDDAVLSRLDEVTTEVKVLLGANPDLWESDGRYL